jgi:hypothetical protein
MKWLFTLACIFIIQLISCNCRSQQLTKGASFPYDTLSPPYQLTAKQWEKLQQKWVKRSLPVTLQLKDDSTVKGQLLFKNDTVIILWADEKLFINPALSDHYIKVIHPDSVSRIMTNEHFSMTDEESGIYWTAMGGFLHGFSFMLLNGNYYEYNLPALFTAIGLGIGCAVDITKLAIKNSKEKKEPGDFSKLPGRIQKKYYFFSNTLPESFSQNIFASFGNHDTFDSVPFEELLIASPQTRRWFRKPSVGLSAQVGPYYSKYQSDLHRTVSLAATYRISGRYTAGYRYRGYSQYDEDWLEQDENSSYESIHRTAHTLFFRYSILQPDYFLMNRFELSAGAGVSLNHFEYNINMLDFYDNVQTSLGYYIGKQNKAGLNIMANIDFYLSKYLSLSMDAEKSFVFSLTTTEQQVWNPRTGQMQIFKAEKYNLSSFDLLFGMQVHF